jgi:hypothetical protein
MPAFINYAETLAKFIQSKDVGKPQNQIEQAVTFVPGRSKLQGHILQGEGRSSMLDSWGSRNQRVERKV